MPIVMSKDEWSRITRWADHDREDPDVVRRREYVRYLDATSNEMTKHWPNSLEVTYLLIFNTYLPTYKFVLICSTYLGTYLYLGRYLGIITNLSN